MTENTAVLASYGLSKTYGACKALDGLNLMVRRGDIYGLVGRNGAGKTTFMRMATGQSTPTGGELELFGASGKDLRAQRSRTGAMIEIPSFSPFLTARENLEYYRLQRGIPGRQAVDEVLELVDLTATGPKKFKSFSLGMKQRLGLALALMNHPDFLILDEPINGLDPEGVAKFRQILRQLNQERQTTILISSHILSELSSVATRYGFMGQGRLLEEILGIPESRVREFFGAAEHPSLYCACPRRHFHVPIYSRAIIRDVRTLEPVGYGVPGLLDLLTPLAKGMPLLSVMTDDLAMSAVAAYAVDGAVAVMALEAGNDLIITMDYRTQIPKVIEALENGMLEEEAVDRACLRVLRWKLELGLLENTEEGTLVRAD